MARKDTNSRGGNVDKNALESNGARTRVRRGSTDRGGCGCYHGVEDEGGGVFPVFLLLPVASNPTRTIVVPIHSSTQSQPGNLYSISVAMRSREGVLDPLKIVCMGSNRCVN